MEIAYEEAAKSDAALDAEARAAQKKALLEKMRKKRAEKQEESRSGGSGGEKGEVSARSSVNDEPKKPGVKVFKNKKLVKAAMPKELQDGEGVFDGIDDMIAQLPSNYNFEVKKTINRILESKSSCVALQMPEGLLMYSCLLADILERYTRVQTIIMGDVTYGACCVDDFTARALGADLLVHYAHSCLVSISETSISVMYVFVDIRFDPGHLVETIKLNFPNRTTRLAIVGTIQFASTFHEAKRLLEPHYDELYIPQAKPLSGGELLGCTSPSLQKGTDAIVYVADGRFHLESIMIANPGVPAYKYDPHSKKFTVEEYDNDKMMAVRRAEIEKARVDAKIVGLIVGTLGRQGNLSIFDRLKDMLKRSGKEVVVVLLSEIVPDKLAMMPDIDVWVQIACPRLSIDWGYAFAKPLLNPYEAMVAFGEVEWRSIYPQDYYAKAGQGGAGPGGPWTNYYKS